MRTIETTAVVTPEHTLTVQLPADIPPGTRRVVVVVDAPPVQRPQPFTAGWPKYDAALTDPLCTFRREDLYGDDGR
jgi:hypothetical protein